MGYVSSMYLYFINLDQNCQQLIILMCFLGRSALTWLRQQKYIEHIFSRSDFFFHVVSFLRMSQLWVLVPKLGNSSTKQNGIFKLPLLLLMTVNNGGNKLFLMCKYVSSKDNSAKRDIFLQGSTLAPFRWSWVQENVSYCHVCLSDLKTHVSVIFTVVQNEWLATNS